MNLKYDRKLIISVGNSRKDMNWKPQAVSVGELWERLKTPQRGSESLSKYMALKKMQQDELKDVGGFVGGSLNGGRRKAWAVTGRDIITLDFDNIPAGATKGVLLAVQMSGAAAAVYSTRKHRPEAPRLRILFPLSRTVSADEYEPIARKMAELVNIAWADPTTFEASRLMFWPSCCSDSEYVFRVWDAPLLNPDNVLKSYSDWHDVRLWPVVPGEDKQRKSGSKQADPTAKQGVVGAFCRLYDIHAAISTFLNGVYVPCDNDQNRYTYSGGSTTGGAVVYDNGMFLYSHHATDPCGGLEVNAFDLVRLHKFGKMDDGAKPGTPSNRLPSYTAMCEFAGQIPDVAAAVANERREEAVRDFEDAVKTEDPPATTTFHRLSAKGVPTEILDANIEEYIIRKNDIFVLNGRPYIYDGGYYRSDEDGKTIKSLIRELIIPDLVNANRIERVYRLFLADARISITDEEINKYPAYWINFRNGMLDVRTGVLHGHGAEYRSVNQIPHDYDASASYSGSVADRFLTGLIVDENDRNMFLTFIGLCMTRDMHFQKFIVLLGPGGIGKSTAAGLVSRVIGKKNMSAVPLQRLNERFQSTALMYKLLNSSTDIPATSMDQTSVVRLITGEDPVPAEFKGGKIFHFDNYARLLFSANEMPAVLSENPAAFYRRLLVIEAKQGEHIENLQEGLTESIPGFIAECIRRLRACYYFGAELDSPNSKNLVKDLLTESDSTLAFMDGYTVRDVSARIPQKELYDRYCGVCYERGWRPKSNQRFYNSVRGMGYATRKSNGKDWIIGVRLAEQN